MKEVTKGIIALVAILAITGGIYAYELFSLRVLKEGDFAEIYYIAYYAENKTVFASSFQENVSYDAPFDTKQYNLTPLKIYLGEGFPKKYPKGWNYGDLGLIEGLRVNEIKGLYKALIGMKKEEEKIIELEPSEAFGLAVENGTIFNSSIILGFEGKFEIVGIGGVTVDLKWLPEIGMKFTMPQYWYNTPITEPYWIWENATEVVSYNDTHVVLKVTPNQLDNLTLYPWWEGASNASYNETKIWITTTPPSTNFTISMFGYTVEGKVLEITKDKIKVELSMGNMTQEQEINRTIVMNRTIELPRIFKDVQKIYVEQDLKALGYSFHKLAGEEVVFRVKLLKIYRVS
ncbi:MAG: hypothetical protein DRN11_03870 [Thermoplasmata archaeon]|nr:MAG: hypothetical protein DRN11_03870 [Thermoplasmata archaeon]